MRILLKIIRWAIGFFFGSTILAVIIYRYMPVYVTPLMVIRSIEHISDGKSVIWHHHWIPLEEMSRHLPVAAMAGEDLKYLSHHGFNFESIKGAIKKNAANGKIQRGGSTISQQTAKNVFLWPSRTWVRKGFEAYFTVLIELFWSKQRIMEVYLNSIEMGDGIYGVEAVAQEHFNCSAKELTRANCALIAATLPNPRVYSSKYPSDYMVKRKYAIMKQMKFIPILPKEGQVVDPSTVDGGIYKN